MHAGVSPKTVSNVMNGYRYILEATRVRVLASIDALGYQMNISARNLKSGRIYARSHGATAAYGIQLRCLGNELDGPWQIGHKTASEYGRLAAETTWTTSSTLSWPAPITSAPS